MLGWDVRVLNEPAPTLRGEIQRILRTFNAEVSSVSGPHPEPLSIEVRDRSGRLVGGLIAQTYWGWLVIDVLGFEPEARGRGLGRHVVELAEATALERGCTRAHTTAYDFQALGFWQRMAYEIVGTLEGYPDGYVMHWMRRDLTPHPAG